MARQFKPLVKLSSAHKHRAMMALHKKWKAHEKQKAILKAIYADGYKRVFVRAGRKFGKNELANYLSWRTCINIHKAECYIIGTTAEAEKKIIWNNERLQDFGPHLNQEVDDANLVLKFPWGSFVQLDGCRNVKDGRGRTFDLCMFDEMKDQKRDYFDAAYPNLLAKDGILFMIGTPPDIDDPDGDFYRDLEEEAKINKNWKYFHFTSYDNPHISRELLDEERAAYVRRGEELIFRREYLAEDVAGSKGRIFPMFDPDFHARPIEVLLAEVRKGIASGHMEFYAIADPGQDVFAVCFFAYNKETQQIYLLDEIYETDRYKTSSEPMWEETQHRKRMLQEFIPMDEWQDVYDEAASHYEVEIMSKFGVKLRATQKKAGKSMLSHVSLLKDAMRVPRCFQVSNTCTHSINEILKFKDLNARNDNHVIDILRYFIEESGYSYQETRETLVVNSRDVIKPRGFTLEQDAKEWDLEQDPFSGLVDFEFDTEPYSDIYGF